MNTPKAHKSHVDRSLFAITLFLAFGLPQFSHADVLALFPFTSGSFASTDVDLNSTASDITLGAGLTGTQAGINSNYLRFTADNFNDAAFNADDYFGFTITSTFGISSWETFEMMVARNQTSTSYGIRLMSRVGADPFTQIGSNQTVNVATTNTFEARSFDLSGLSALAAGATREFHLQINRSVGTNGTTREVRFDNVELNAVVIPEPGTLALVGISLLSLALLRRRK